MLLIKSLSYFIKRFIINLSLLDLIENFFFINSIKNYQESKKFTIYRQTTVSIFCFFFWYIIHIFLECSKLAQWNILFQVDELIYTIQVSYISNFHFNWSNIWSEFLFSSDRIKILFRFFQIEFWKECQDCMLPKDGDYDGKLLWRLLSVISAHFDVGWPVDSHDISCWCLWTFQAS